MGHWTHILPARLEQSSFSPSLSLSSLTPLGVFCHIIGGLVCMKGSHAEYLFRCLLIVFIFLSIQCLFISFVYFLVVAFDFLTIEIWECFYILHADYLFSLSLSRIVFQILDCLCSLLTLLFTHVKNMPNSRKDVSGPQSQNLSLIFMTVLTCYVLY